MVLTFYDDDSKETKEEKTLPKVLSYESLGCGWYSRKIKNEMKVSNKRRKRSNNSWPKARKCL
jgi:hypothetical protein